MIKKTCILLCIALYLSYYAGISMFSHVHIINGATIFHSHIHTDSHHDSKHGGHTEQNITLIAQISHFEYIDFSCDCIIKATQFSLNESKFVETAFCAASVHLENPQLRAPPALV